MQRGTALVAAWAALALAAPARAQDSGSVSDFRLPPQPAPSPAPVVGPVDTENPAPRPAAPDPQPSQPATRETAVPTPRIVLPGVPAAERPQPGRQPVAGRAVIPAPTPATPSPLPEANPSLALPTAQPTVAASPQSPSAPEQGFSWWLALAGGLAALLALGAWLWRRRKASLPTDDIALTEPELALPEPAPQPPPVSAPAPPFRPAFGVSPIGLTFAPQSLRLSLVYATLSYRLELTNHGDAPLEALRIAGDMISAHASLPSWRQLSFEPDAAEAKHSITALDPGQSAVLDGELRLPLTNILPVRAGAAQLFVPLARFLVESGGGTADTHVFSIGQPGGGSDGGMAAFRLDHGPQLYSEVEQREVDVARWLPVDTMRRAG